MKSHIEHWVAENLPEGLFTGPAEIRVDGEEIQIIGPVAFEEGSESQAIRDHREDTREQRIEVALAAEDLFNRKVSWGARAGERTELFTVAGVPVMTRLRFDERQVLDTLVASSAARSRSDALAWCVRLVGEHENEWLSELREALEKVHKVRADGPKPS